MMILNLNILSFTYIRKSRYHVTYIHHKSRNRQIGTAGINIFLHFYKESEVIASSIYTCVHISN